MREVKEVFILKEIRDIEYLVINKKDTEVFCDIMSARYIVKYYKEKCLSEKEIREYFIQDRGFNYTTKELKKPSLYDYNAGQDDKLFGDLIIVKHDKYEEELEKIIYSLKGSDTYQIKCDYMRNSAEVIWNMKKIKKVQ